MTTIGSKYRGTKEYHLVFCRLVAAARRKEEVLYVDVAELIGVPRTGQHMGREVGQILGEISEDEHQAGRPMLSAVAVSAKGVPGEGFFVLARRLGRLGPEPEQSDIGFWLAETQKVFETWQK